MEPKIQDSVTQLLNGKMFYGKPEKAFQDMQAEEYTGVFMPQLVDALIKSPDGTAIWNDDLRENMVYYTPSLVAYGHTGRTKKVAVFAHTNSYLTDPLNLSASEKNAENKYGYATIPAKRFYGLVELDGAKDFFGNRVVWVCDFSAISHVIGSMDIEKAAKNPRLVAMIGSEERTEKYLERYQGHFGSRISMSNFDAFPEDHVEGYFMGISANGGIMDYISPLESVVKPQFIGVNKKNRPNSFEIIDIAKRVCTVNSRLHNFEEIVFEEYVKTGREGYTESNKPKAENFDFYREARPSLDQILPLLRFLPQDRESRETLISKISGLFQF